MDKKILLTGAVVGATGVVFGAFGAHALKDLVSVEAQQSFETGVRYQIYHAFFLLFVGSVAFIEKKLKNTLFYLTLAGIVLFSGSIYGLATNSLTGFDFKTIAWVTPIGGLLIIMSWCLLIVNFFKMKTEC
ncbi:DUF423 domain-containing protein [Flavobacteriaceae bacterium GSB9]|nr:DUF423 domain-containing protein [Flavobacteriaceae bacterium GSB9]